MTIYKCGSAESCHFGEMCKHKYDIGGCSHFEQKKPPAHWIAENQRPKSYKWICSECGQIVYDRPICAKRHTATKPLCSYKFCPYCGVKMGEVAE